MPYKKMLGLLILAAAPMAGADVLLLDGVEMNAQTASSRPARGMTMTRVEAAFGAPTSRRAAIGDPPITRWDYPGFSVYFEYDHVIHAVARR
ncbi:MAG: hypothetical protein JXB36_15880 [Gammaproteobacteria bacterium]|nr:hypothetical protein [Gammaproteobacteria bacterium]